jgi:hypothetical protein
MRAIAEFYFDQRAETDFNAGVPPAQSFVRSSAAAVGADNFTSTPRQVSRFDLTEKDQRVRANFRVAIAAA